MQQLKVKQFLLPINLQNLIMELNIQVPPFIESGDTILIDTRTMEYVKKI